jgi:hypothetical protein
MGLQVALFVSPIFLLAQKKLCAMSWDKEELIRVGVVFRLNPNLFLTVFKFSKALGNQKPAIITQVEKAIWLALFKIAEGTMQPYMALRSLSETLPWEDIERMNVEELQWFKPGMFSGQFLLLAY